MMALFFKALIGAAVVLLIALFARSRNFVIAGLVPLFPTFSLIAHAVVGSERSAADLQQTALFGLWSLAPYAAYLLVVWWGSVRWPLAVTLAVATLVWVVLALVMLWLWLLAHP